jgi:hypothetical protein
MLSFIESLKEVVSEVQATGGAVVERTRPSPALLRRLKDYTMDRLQSSTHIGNLIADWFVGQMFDEYVRVCVVHLCKQTLGDEELQYLSLIRIIDRVLERELGADEVGEPPEHEYYYTESVFEHGLAAGMVSIWDGLGDRQTVAYTFAKDRWLIAWV